MIYDILYIVESAQRSTITPSQGVTLYSGSARPWPPATARVWTAAATWAAHHSPAATRAQHLTAGPLP